MANLSSIDKLKLEKYLDMASGHVCDFSNFSFKNFVLENANIDIYSDKYNFSSGSKANRLRSFWSQENDHIVAKLLEEIIEYWRFKKMTPMPDYSVFNQMLHTECLSVIGKLKLGKTIDDIDFIKPNSSEESFSILASSIKENVHKNQPHAALDHLHTFVVKYLRVLCEKRNIIYDKKTPLNSLMGGYVKYLREKNLVRSEMSLRILSSAIKVLGSLDAVRNNESLAHDNPLLSKEESILILNHVSSLIRFIKSIEDKIIDNEKILNTMTREEDWPTDEEIEAAGDAWIQMQIDISRGK